MSTVTNEIQLTQPRLLRLLAHSVSYVFHPVFVPVYVVLFLLYEHPFHFLGYAAKQKAMVLVQALAMYTFFPLVTVGLLRALGFIRSFQLHDRKDRIIPLVACGIWYFWIWYVWRNMAGQSLVTVQFALGVWLAASLGLLLNSYTKISLHALSVGVALCFMLLLSLQESLHYGGWLSIAIFLTGLVCAARFVVSDHRAIDIYGGVFAGVLCMLIGWVVG